MSSVDSGNEKMKAQWRSLEDRAGAVAADSEADASHGRAASRRDFLKLMGASAALAGATACRWPKEKIVPFSYRAPDRAPGVAEQFATAFELAGVARGLLVTSNDGRPTKIEGNPLHPESLGAADAISQASILTLYDPDRSKVLVHRAGGSALNRAWAELMEFAGAHFGALRAAGGRRLRILSEATSSPSVQDMKQRLLQAYPMARCFEYEPVSRDNERAGAALAFGKPFRTHLRIDRAALVVCFDADILGSHPAAIRHARELARGRDAENGRMNRLYAFESVFSLTGSMADRRHAMRPDEITSLLGGLAAEILSAQGVTPSYLTPESLAALDRLRLSGQSGRHPTRLAKDLIANRGAGIIVAGPGLPPEAHALVHALNEALGNSGATIEYTADEDPSRPSHVEALRTLCSEMAGGEVETLLILGGNPVYDAPADFDFAGYLKKVPAAIHLAQYSDETSEHCLWHLPLAHYLETWADARAWDGTISITQPLIAPLYLGKTVAEVLSIVCDDKPLTAHDIVRRTYAQRVGGAESTGLEKHWRRSLHDGVVAGSAYGIEAATVSGDAVRSVIASDVFSASPAKTLDLVFYPDSRLFDGRFANNGWLQELPDPLTKLTWENALLLGPATAAELGFTTGDVARIGSGERDAEAPVCVLPGLSAGVAAIALGHGRTRCGKVGENTGVNAYALRTSGAMHAARGLRITPTGRRHKLATTQDHHLIDSVGYKERSRRTSELARQATLEEYLKEPDIVKHRVETPPLIQLFGDHKYEGHKWAMSIDLSACTGCSACVVACQAENNIPVVGKDEVARGREMHWIRVDRYFSGDPDSPLVTNQPVTCQQCENAPCEQVCPVGATQHSHEGLNDMVYNRCVGTRYCSNNCPYKVRRFNWFNNQKDVSPIETMQYNPEVSVRSRGVMEKCTFCIQRISAVRIAAKNAGRPIADGEITPACAQTCPTQAIVFGDLNDPMSRVAKLHQHRRSYGLLEELNVRPRLKYQAKLRNPGEPEEA